MKSRKNRELKKRLEREMPYPRVTVQADLRFDRILAALPEREALGEQAKSSAEGKRVSQGPAHYRKKPEKSRGAGAVLPEGIELPEGLEYFEPVPFQRSWSKTILQSAAALAVFCLVCLILLNTASPEIAENLPGFGGLFQTINGRLKPDPLDSSANVSELPAETPYTISVEEAVWEGEYLFQTVRLDFTEETCPETDQLFTTLEGESGIKVLMGGRSAVLYRDPVFERIEGEPAFRGTVIAALSGEHEARGTVTISRLLGVTRREGPSSFEEPDIILSQTVSCDIEAKEENHYSNFYEEGLAAINHVTLRDYSSTETEFTVEIGYPRMSNNICPYITVCPVDGEPLHPDSTETFGNEGQYGEPAGQISIFEAVPEGTSAVIVTVNTKKPGNPSIYVNGNIMDADVLAEFQVDLETGEVWDAYAYQDHGFDFVSLEGYAAAWEAGLRFRDHVLPVQWEQPFSYAFSDFASEEALHLLVVSDLDLALPLQLELYRYGDPLETLPLYPVSQSMEHEDGSYCNEGQYGSITARKMDIGPSAELDSDFWGVSRWRQYEITLFPLESGFSWGLEEYGCWVVLRNVVTGEIVAGSQLKEDPGNINMHKELIGTQEELKLERPSFFDPIADWGIERSGTDGFSSVPSATPFPSSAPVDEASEISGASDVEY